MKKGVIIAIIVVSFVVLSSIYFKWSSDQDVLFSPIDSRACEDADVISLWSSMFIEPSSGLTIVSNTTDREACNSFYAYKISGDFIYVLSGINISGEVVIQAIRVNSTQTYEDMITGITSINSDTIEDIITPTMVDIDNNSKNRTFDITQVRDEFRSIYKISIIPDWVESTQSSKLAYEFTESDKTHLVNITTSGVSFANHSVTYILFRAKFNVSIGSCTPNWTSSNTNCTSNEKITVYYLDSNSCNVETRIPSNITIPCDYDHNGIIGNFSINSSLNLNVQINDSPGNLSRNYSGLGVQEVLIRQGGQTLVKFDWDFGTPLNLQEMYLEKNSDVSNLGYILVKGLEVNKTVYLERKSDSSLICIRDSEIDSINMITTSCSSGRESRIGCPDINEGFSCSLSGSYYKISGLMNSGAIEMSRNSNPPSRCIPDWTCTSWSACSNNQQVRTCIDNNLCNTLLNKPSVNKSCNASCNPDWTCTSWSACSNNQQTRTCTDKNGCNSTNRPSETQACQGSGSGGSDDDLDEEEPGGMRWGIIIILIFGIITGIIGVLIYVFLRNNKNNSPSPIIEGLGSSIPVSPSGPPPIPPLPPNSKPPQPIRSRLGPPLRRGWMPRRPRPT